MLGGGSVIMIAMLGLLFQLWGKTEMYIVALALYVGNTLFTYPHFAFSYLLFYDGFFERLASKETTTASKVRLMIAGIIVPIVAAALFLACYIFKSAALLAFLLIGTAFLTGWHYSKQGYGALITLSVYKKSFYSAREKMAFYGNAYSIWVFSAAAWFSRHKPTSEYSGLPLHFFALPQALLIGLALVSVATTIAVLFIFAKRYRADPVKFPLNGALAYLASLYLWAVLFHYNIWALFVVVPIFHSLQYLFFIWKFKSGEFTTALRKNREAGKSTGIAGLVAFIVAGFLLGSAFITVLPQHLDHLHISPLGAKVAFFYIAFQTFINLHHYFMDSAFWRKDNTSVQQYLFKAGQ
jgi:hypothetical protein